jgi:hypothetical protein
MVQNVTNVNLVTILPCVVNNVGKDAPTKIVQYHQENVLASRLTLSMEHVIIARVISMVMNVIKHVLVTVSHVYQIQNVHCV